MRRITLAVVVTVAVLVLLFSYHTSLNRDAASSAPQLVSGPQVLTGSVAAAGPPGSPSSLTPGVSEQQPSAAAPTAVKGATQTVRGAEEMTRYGAVQVQVTITGGRITDVAALEYPTRDPMDQQINADAIPELRNQVLSAQSANVQGVSGATFTTEGYVASVQSALDAAGFRS